MEVACSSQVPSIQDPAESATGEFLRGLFVFILLDSGPRRVRFSSALLGAHRGKRTRGSASSRGVLYSCTGSTFCHVDVRFSYQWSAPPSRLATCSLHLLTALAHGHLLTATCSRQLARSRSRNLRSDICFCLCTQLHDLGCSLPLRLRQVSREKKLPGTGGSPQPKHKLQRGRC